MKGYQVSGLSKLSPN